MSEQVESAERFYIVTAHRHGYRDAHSYIVGLFSSQSTAILAAEREEAYRGGKYACCVFGTEVLEEWSANPSLNLIREAAEDLRFASPRQQIKNAAAQARREALGGEQAEECQVRAGEGTLTASPPAPVANCKHCGHMAYAHAQGEQPFQYVEEGFKCWAEKCDCPGYEAETRECQ